jgi:hypothetical protein
VDVTVFIEPKVDLERLARVMDDLGHEGRLHTIRTWGGNKLAKLFDAAQGFRRVTLDHFVPGGTPPMTQVLHEGKNSLPMFSHFRKLLCRPEGEENVLWGYNQNWHEPFSGHGYFVARPSDIEGEVVFDYGLLPKNKLSSWPPLVDNSARLGRFIWVGLVDQMRGLSSHVSLGRVARGGRVTDNYFALCRRDS